MAGIEKLPLKTYQRNAAQFGQEGRGSKAIVTLQEAVEFYPLDVQTLGVLIDLFDRTRRGTEAQPYRERLYDLNLRNSEAFCTTEAERLHFGGNAIGAVQLLSTAIQYHPRSLAVHDRMTHACEAVGDTVKANFHRNICAQLWQQQQYAATQQQNMNDARAHGNETAGMVAGAAIGTTGAVVGTGVTILGVLAGLAVVAIGVLCCFFSVILFMTCIGLPLGILLMGAGFSIIAAGCAIMAGGAAIGAMGGFMGILSGGLTSGTALLHRSSRLKGRK